MLQNHPLIFPVFITTALRFSLWVQSKLISHYTKSGPQLEFTALVRTLLGEDKAVDKGYGGGTKPSTSMEMLE